MLRAGVAVTCHCWVPPWASGKERFLWNLRFPWISRGRFGEKRRLRPPQLSLRCLRAGGAAPLRAVRAEALPGRGFPARSARAALARSAASGASAAFPSGPGQDGGCGGGPPGVIGLHPPPSGLHPPRRRRPGLGAFMRDGEWASPGAAGVPRPGGTQRGGSGAEGRERPGRPVELDGAAASPCAGRKARP